MTIPVGTITAGARALVAATEESLYAGIVKAVPGGRLFDISHAVQSHVEAKGFSVVRDFVGHGIGRNLHEEPQVPNFGAPGTGVRLKAGMVLAIEPMVNEGSHEVRILEDGWTVVTCDGGLSAHFEHTVAITDKGPEILTRI
jgi:methionyl aminopeptidase